MLLRVGEKPFTDEAIFVRHRGMPLLARPEVAPEVRQVPPLPEAPSDSVALLGRMVAHFETVRVHGDLKNPGFVRLDHDTVLYRPTYDMHVPHRGTEHLPPGHTYVNSIIARTTLDGLAHVIVVNAAGATLAGNPEDQPDHLPAEVVAEAILATVPYNWSMNEVTLGSPPEFAASMAHV